MYLLFFFFFEGNTLGYIQMHFSLMREITRKKKFIINFQANKSFFFLKETHTEKKFLIDFQVSKIGQHAIQV